jgi:hypothetical protein
MTMSKERILSEIRRTAKENGGVPLGAARFATETGISVGMWRGKHWRVWSDALMEAGFQPNQKHEAHSKEVLLGHMIALMRRLRRFPTYTDLRMARQADPSFPGHMPFQNLGPLPERIAMVRAYAAERPEDSDILDLLPSVDDEPEVAPADDPAPKDVDGAVYMLKLGKHYKVGKSFRVPQRHREIAIELPEKPDVVHVIATDDPSGIEAYWHGRFAAKRPNGEWFALSADDVRAFRRRRFM